MYRLSLQAQAVYGLRQAFSDASAFEQTEGLDACHLPKLAQNPSAQSRGGKHDPSLAVKPRLEAAANTKLQPSLQQQQQQQHP